MLTRRNYMSSLPVWLHYLTGAGKRLASSPGSTLGCFMVCLYVCLAHVFVWQLGGGGQRESEEKTEALMKRFIIILVAQILRVDAFFFYVTDMARAKVP